MTTHFPNARLITYASTQHVSWTGRSSCVNTTADQYLITDQLPANVNCPSTHP
jgi:hypothetical protein